MVFAGGDATGTAMGPPRTSVETLSPLVRRVLAGNPSPYTFTGTWTHIVGTGAVAVIDPGPAIPAHVDAILAALGGARVAAILVTHHHGDHSPASRPLAAATGAPIFGCAPIARGSGGGIEDAFDRDYAPDRVLADGETLDGDGWSLTAVATPGHTSNHLCFALPQERALFSGDHVMGWSTSVVIPPDGDMGDYIASLEKVRARGETVHYPAHGDPVTDPQRLVRGMIGHRRMREGQIVRAVGRGTGSVAALVTDMYPELDLGLRGVAALSVEAHLIDLARRGVAAQDDGVWRLTGEAPISAA